MAQRLFLTINTFEWSHHKEVLAKLGSIQRYVKTGGFAFFVERDIPDCQLIAIRTHAWPMNRKDPGIVVLFVVDSTSSLTSQEKAKKLLMESWGFTVNIIRAADSQAALDFHSAGLVDANERISLLDIVVLLDVIDDYGSGDRRNDPRAGFVGLCPFQLRGDKGPSRFEYLRPLLMGGQVVPHLSNKF